MSEVDNPDLDGVTDEDVAAATPAPITPGSSASAHHNRVGYENEINAAAEAFAAEARVKAVEILLAGGTNLRIEADGLPDDSDGSDIAPETALAFAADEGLTPYSEWTKDELAEECRNRELAVSGTKDELIERLQASDAEDAAVDPEAD